MPNGAVFIASDAQDLWEAVFVAALTGCAREPYQAEKDRVYTINRAEAVADDAVDRIIKRRKATERARDAASR